MFDPLRVAVAVEGPTDSIVLDAIVRSLLRHTDFVFQTLQPKDPSRLARSQSAEPATDGLECSVGAVNRRWKAVARCPGLRR